MGDIAECFDVESSTDEDIATPVTKEESPAVTTDTKATKEVADLAVKKWEVLSEDKWSEFNDEEAVFDFIANAISESILKRNEDEVTPKTEVELLMQV